MYLLAVVVLLSLCSGQDLDSQTLYQECFGEDEVPCLGGGCVTFAQQCDGRADCADGSDEDFCPQLNPDPVLCNLTHQFLCEDLKGCIPNSWVCNNEPECEDGSDEANCTALQLPANSTCKGFVCDGTKCISPLWLCDGRYDCLDKTDEYSLENCRHAQLTHSAHDSTACEKPGDSYQCLDSSLCLPRRYMCDGLVDCRDGSDEGEFCKHWHTLCTTNNPCKGNATCRPERTAPTCLCPPGHQYDNSSGMCTDVDECALPRPVCAHACQNEHGKFSCRCDEGYSAAVSNGTNEHLCSADGPEAILFFTTKSDIRYVKIKSKQEVVVAKDIKEAHGVSYDGKYLYWVETTQGHQAIMRAHLEDVQNTKEVLVSLGLEDPGDIALDWAAGNLYFSDVHRGAIFACRTDGSVCAKLDTDARRPRFVTLAVRYGQMFWADWHHRPVIMTARMDGRSSRVLVDHLRGPASGLAVDVPNGRLYYVDDTIRVFKIDGGVTYTLFEEPFHHPYSVAVFENTVYWSDRTSNTIQATDKILGTTHKRYIVTSSDTPVYDMHIYQPSLLERIQDPCSHQPCSHLCLRSAGDRATCVCPYGMMLRNNTECQHNAGYRPLYLVVGGGPNFTRVDYTGLGNPESHTTHFDIGRVQAMTYDNTRDTLYMYDGQRKTINFINMTDFSLGITHQFINLGLENVIDMDYDVATDSLYFIDAGRGFVEAMSLRTHQRALVARFQDQEVPVSFCVMSDYGRMLVAVMKREQDNVIHIVSIGLDGEDRKTIIMNDLQGPKVLLRYDQNRGLVYMADEGNSIIETIHPGGTGREIFRDLPSTVTNLAVTDVYAFWTDRRTRLYWSNLHEITHLNIRKIDFSIFPEHTQLHLQATFPPPEPKNPLLSHPCLTTHPCSHVCLQTPRPFSTGANPSSLQYKCFCPPGLLNTNGSCHHLARCSEKELYCHKSNACIYKGKYCDGFKDCSDGEDEENCEEAIHEPANGCPKGYKLCRNICVDEQQICDVEIINTPTTTTAPSQCTEAEFQCVNSSICIERAQTCDGKPDCLNGSDEAPAVCDLLSCRSNEFMCALGSCIFKVFRCDGEYDCADGSDEVDCETKTCPLGYYQCDDGECIEQTKRCDGTEDCLDLSDEKECGEPELENEPMQTCADGEFSCLLNRSICLPSSARCNGTSECPGGSDELSCDVHCARRGMWSCRRGHTCIARARLCDGRADCTDGSDEEPEVCGTANMTATALPPLVLPASECHDGFLCDNGQCLEWHQICDHQPDCQDRTDEGGLCATACANASCSDCQATPRGAACRCGAGLRPQGSDCAPGPACALGACAQLCRSQSGDFRCACYHGYALRPDHRTCKAAEGELAILYTSGNTVWAISAGKVSVLHNDPKNAAIADMDVDVRRNKLYLSFTEAGQVVEANSTTTDVVITNIGRPTKVAVDWITGNVYFVDSTPESHCIRVCNVVQKRCARLQDMPANTEITALAVDPPYGRMFYCASRNISSEVWTASLAGQYEHAVATVGLCSGIAVDSFRKQLYVTERDPGSVVRMDYNGANQQTVLDARDKIHSPRGLALFEDSLFFLTSEKLRLTRCSLFGKKHCEPYLVRDIGAESFVVRHASAQRGDVADACADAGSCAGLCVSGARGPVCVRDRGSVEERQLALFNGWSGPAAARAARAGLAALGAVLGAAALCLLVCLYQLAKRPQRVTDYMEVRFRNTSDRTPAPVATVVELPDHAISANEFVNPLEYVRDLWENVRRQTRPVGTAGLDINVPYLQQDLSDTESDMDEREKNIVRNRQRNLNFTEEG
uniref:Vitellogenin receptor n=1 Tax=Maruca vitrata TaxID=497515 RepID=A0A385HW27_MARVT|nr:vitellogenin receptor [Maruca vitrata]